MKTIASLVLILHGFSEIFAFSAYVSISFISEIVYISLVLIFYKNVFTSKFLNEFFIFVVVLIATTYIYSLFSGISDDKSFLNLFQYIIILFHIFVLTDIFRRFGREFFFKHFLTGFFIVISFGYADFFFSNVLSFSLDSVLPRSSVQYNTGSQLGLMRMRSVFREAGYYANYLNVCALVLLGYYYGSKKFTLILFGYISSLLLTFSGTGIVCAIIMFTVKMVVFSERNVRKNIQKIIVFSILATSSVYTLSGNEYVEKLVDKITLDDSSASVRDRSNRYSYLSSDLDVLTNSYVNLLTGLGNGHLISEQRSYLNIYINFLISNGIIVFISFTFVIISAFKFIFKQARRDKAYEYILLSLFSFLFHFLFTQGTFILALWLPLICYPLLLRCDYKKNYDKALLG